MDKNWWNTLKNNKALKSFKRYILKIINDLNEREIKEHMFKKDIDIDQILIEESSKEIDNYLKIKQKAKKKQILNSTKKIEGKRNINLLYMCLLKFNGLLRYMYFQGLNHDDINKMAHYIKHTFRKKGTYVFRQFDKSNALYGVIKGRAVIRLIETKDYTRKFSNEASHGGDIKSNPPERIHVNYFMSDCEEEIEEEEEEEEENENEKKEKKGKKEKKEKKEKKNKDENNEEEKKELSESDENEDINKILNSHLNKNISQKKLSHIKINILESKKNKEKKNKRKKIQRHNSGDNNIKFNLHDLKEKIKLLKKKNEEKKETKIIKAILVHQTPTEPLNGNVLNNFIKEFETENFSLTNGMCFGEWGLLYSIPRTTSIYAAEDTHLFYLEKEYFNKTLFPKFLKNDSEKIKFLLRKFPIFQKHFKIRHIFTKIIPLFVNKDSIIYTPFDNAENIYLLYQGEGVLVNLPSVKEKEDFILKKTNWNIISRLQSGAIAGIESCLENNSKYENAFIITREFSTILKLNIKYMTEMYKDFCKSLIPLYKSQQLIYKLIKKSNERVHKIYEKKRKFSLSNVVKEVLDNNKKRTFSNDLHISNLKINLSKNKYEKIPKKQLNQFRLKLNNDNKNINTLFKNKLAMDNKLIMDNLSTRRKSNISPLSSDRGKNYEILSHSSSRNTQNTNFYFSSDKNSLLYKTNYSSISTSHIRCKSAFSKKINHSSHSNLKAEKVFEDLKNKLLNYQIIDTGMFNLPLLSDHDNKTITDSYK